MFKKNTSTHNLTSLFSLVMCMALTLNACSGSAPIAAVTQPEPAPIKAAATAVPTQLPATATTLPTKPAAIATSAPKGPVAPPEFTLTVKKDNMSVPDHVPAGLVRLNSYNFEMDWHSTIFRRLNDDVKLDDFAAAFKKDPVSTMPMTSYLGGPDVPGGTILAGYYTLTPGTFIIVDNSNDPWRFSSFQVAGTANQAAAPQADISVIEKEYSFDMPKSIPTGINLWKFTNLGKALHNVAIVRLNQGKTIKDLITFVKDSQGKPPYEYLAAWNFLSPGVTSWGEVDLQPGEYMIVDAAPDFASGEGLNAEKGMYAAFTVRP
jgi:hypothetical protein